MTALSGITGFVLLMVPDYPDYGEIASKIHNMTGNSVTLVHVGSHVEHFTPNPVQLCTAGAGGRQKKNREKCTINNSEVGCECSVGKSEMSVSHSQWHDDSSWPALSHIPNVQLSSK